MDALLEHGHWEGAVFVLHRPLAILVGPAGTPSVLDRFDTGWLDDASRALFVQHLAEALIGHSTDHPT